MEAVCCGSGEQAAGKVVLFSHYDFSSLMRAIPKHRTPNLFGPETDFSKPDTHPGTALPPSHWIEWIELSWRKRTRACIEAYMLNEIRYALRTLRQNPGFALTAIISIALAVRANSTI